MSPRERNLRERIDQLRDERDYWKARIPKSKLNGRRMAHCVYCGAKCKTYKTPPACIAHRDLTSLDPFYEEWAA